MRPIIVLLLLMTASLTRHANAAARFVQHSLDPHGKTYSYQVYVPDGWTAKRSWPVVLFLHGSGERGSDNQGQLSQGLPPWLRQHGKNFPGIVVIPQAPQHSAWSGEVEQMALQTLGDSITTYHGDRQRLYLTGLSMGGYGSWQIALDHRGAFAAAAIICGGIRHPNDSGRLRVQGVPAGVADIRTPGLPHTSASCRYGSSTAPSTTWCRRQNRSACTPPSRRVATMSVTPSSPVSAMAHGTRPMPPLNCARGCSRTGCGLPRQRPESGSDASIRPAPAAAQHPADRDAQRHPEQFAQHPRTHAIRVVHLCQLGLQQLQ